MAYKKMGRRRPKKQVSWYNRKYSTAQLAMKAWLAAKYVKSIVNVEMKKHDGTSSTTVANSGSYVTPLTDVAQGDSISTRDGNSFKAKGLSINYTIKQHASATNTQVCVVLVRDNQQIADTDPAWNTIFNDTSVRAVLNAAFVGRFSIIYDRVHLLSSNGQTQAFSKNYIKLNSHIRFNGTAATDIQKSGLTFFAIADEATNLPTLDLAYRLTFVDN